jgi:hypothetical protein
MLESHVGRRDSMRRRGEFIEALGGVAMRPFAALNQSDGDDDDAFHDIAVRIVA